jgi:hypothetical protein
VSARRRVAVLAALLCVSAASAPAAELLQCRAQQHTIGYRRTVPDASIHLIHVDPFRDQIFFDGTWFSLNRMDPAVISGWGHRIGRHGPETLSLDIDRVAGTFDFFVDVDGQPQFAYELQGTCGPARVEPWF